jgi:prepilin-type N-terminal cleavage/methylation domain-containing protein
MVENHPKFPALHALRTKRVSDSLKRRLASSRSVEITGFTLIELLIVMAIISVLATIAYYKYSAFIDQTKDTKAIADLKQIAQLIDDFKEVNGRYPENLDELGRGTFKDPWGNPYQYVNISEDDKKGKDKQKARRDRNQKPINTYFDLWSNGADGDFQQQVNGAKSRDDIIYAWDGSFVGLGKDLDELYGKPRSWKHPSDDMTEDTDKDKGKDKDTEAPTTTTPTTVEPTTAPPTTEKPKGKDKDTETTTTTTTTTVEATTVPPTTEKPKGKSGG